MSKQSIRAARRRTSWRRVHSLCWLAAGAALAAGDASAAVIFSTSAGGNWSAANTWMPPGVPNNNETDQFVVTLSQAITLANLNNTTIDAITIDPTATLRFPPNTTFNVVAGPFTNNGLAELPNGDFSSLILNASAFTGTGAVNITGNNAFFQLYTPHGAPLLIDSKQTVTITGNNQLDLLTGVDLKGTLSATNSRIFVNGDVTLANTLNIGSGSIQISSPVTGQGGKIVGGSGSKATFNFATLTNFELDVDTASLFNATLNGMTLRGAIEGANALFEGTNVNNGNIRIVGNASIIGNAAINGTGGLTVNTGAANFIPGSSNPTSLTLGPQQSFDVIGKNVSAFVSNFSFTSQGPITVNAATFQVQGNPSAFIATGPLNVINGGGVNINSQTATLGGPITVDTTSTVTFQNVDTILNTQVLSGGGDVKFIGGSLTFNRPQFSNGVRFFVADLDADFTTPATITGVAGGQPITFNNITATGQSATFDLPVDFSGGLTTFKMPAEFRGGVRVTSSLELDNRTVSVQPVQVIGPSASLTIGANAGGSNFDVDLQGGAKVSLITQGTQTMTVNVGGDGNMDISYGAGNTQVLGDINLPQNTVTFRPDPFSPPGASTVTFGKITALNLDAFGQFGSPSTLKVNQLSTANNVTIHEGVNLSAPGGFNIPDQFQWNGTLADGPFNTGPASTTFIFDPAAASNANITLGGTTQVGGSIANLNLDNSNVTVPIGGLFRLNRAITFTGNPGSTFTNLGTLDQTSFSASTTFATSLSQGVGGLSITRGRTRITRNSALDGIVRVVAGGTLELGGNATHTFENPIEGDGTVQAGQFGVNDGTVVTLRNGLNLTGAGSRVDIFDGATVQNDAENKAVVANVQTTGTGQWRLRTSPGSRKGFRGSGSLRFTKFDFTAGRPAAEQSEQESFAADLMFVDGDASLEGGHGHVNSMELSFGEFNLGNLALITVGQANVFPGSRTAGPGEFRVSKLLDYRPGFPGQTDKSIWDAKTTLLPEAIMAIRKGVDARIAKINADRADVTLETGAKLSVSGQSSGTRYQLAPSSELTFDDITNLIETNQNLVNLNDSKLITVSELELVATMLGTGRVAFRAIRDSEGNVAFDGSIFSPGSSPGLLTATGDIALTDDSSIVLEIGGRTAVTQYDRFVVNGELLLDDVSLDTIVLPAFTGIAPADSFTVITATTLSGTFSNALPDSTVMTSDNLYSFTLRYGATSPFNPNHVVLTDFQPVPEPAMGTFLFVGLLPLLRRRRRVFAD